MSYYEWQKYFEYNDREFELRIEFSVYFERDYGADADGNRGMPMHFVEVEKFEIYDADILVDDKQIIEYAEKWYDKNHSMDAESEAIQDYKDSYGY